MWKDVQEQPDDLLRNIESVDTTLTLNTTVDPTTSESTVISEIEDFKEAMLKFSAITRVNLPPSVPSTVHVMDSKLSSEGDEPGISEPIPLHLRSAMIQGDIDARGKLPLNPASCDKEWNVNPSIGSDMANLGPSNQPEDDAGSGVLDPDSRNDLVLTHKDKAKQDGLIPPSDDSVKPTSIQLCP